MSICFNNIFYSKNHKNLYIPTFFAIIHFITTTYRMYRAFQLYIVYTFFLRSSRLSKCFSLTTVR